MFKKGDKVKLKYYGNYGDYFQHKDQVATVEEVLTNHSFDSAFTHSIIWKDKTRSRSHVENMILVGRSSSIFKLIKYKLELFVK